MTEPGLQRTRAIRVFVSSTFRDMGAERDHLVKFVFPQLRKLCEARGVMWTEVDLRWGITEEQAAEGRVLPICLEEIHRCRPYFIGLLGERYGWVPEGLPSGLVEHHPWLEQLRQHSVTELEIIHGVLREAAMHGHAYFYFRDPGYLDRLPPGSTPGNFASESAESGTKLARLKQRLRAAAAEEVCRVRENYRDPEELGRWILDDLSQLIQQLFPEDRTPSPLDRAAAEHDLVAERHARVYVARQADLERLDAHAGSHDPPLLILGASGVGKSALLANWFRRFRDSHPRHFALIHFAGGTPGSTDPIRLLTRIMGELKRGFRLPDELPTQPESIREEFPRWLASASALGPLVMVLDGLDQMEAGSSAHDFGWLPEAFPPNCRVFIATLPGPSLDAMRRRGWSQMTVQPLSVPERHELMAQFLGQYTKALSPARMKSIAVVEQTGNPLFLRAMLDELRQFGAHERLAERIEHYLAARNPRELYDRILARWELDYGETVVRQSLTLIWAARYGLSEAELLDLLGQDGQPYPRAFWSPWYLAAEAGLVQRSGLISFFHDYLRDAVRDRFLPTLDARRAGHQRLAAYFARGENPSRQFKELPWQYQQAEDWSKLHALLTDPLFVGRFYDPDDPVELLRYWSALHARCSVGESYAEATLRRWAEVLPFVLTVRQAVRALSAIGDLLQNLGAHRLAECWHQAALQMSEAELGRDDPTTLSCVNNIAVAHSRGQDRTRAEPMFRRLAETTERILGPEHPNALKTVHNLAVLLAQAGNLDEAEALYRRVWPVRERVLGREHLVTLQTLHSLASLILRRKDYAAARPLIERVIAASTRSLGTDHPLTLSAQDNLMTCLFCLGAREEAHQLGQQLIEVSERVLGPSHPDTLARIASLGSILFVMHRDHEAKQLLQQAATQRRAVLGAGHPTVQGCERLLEKIQARARIHPEAAPPADIPAPKPPGKSVREATDVLRTLLESGQHELAEKGCRRLIAKHANDPPAVESVQGLLAACVVMKALDRLARKEATGAIVQLFEEAIALAPSDPALHRNVAVTLWEELKERRAAERVFLKALELDPHDATSQRAYEKFKAESAGT